MSLTVPSDPVQTEPRPARDLQGGESHTHRPYRRASLGSLLVLAACGAGDGTDLDDTDDATVEYDEQLAFVDGEVRGRDALPISDGVHEVEARADGTIEVRRVGEREPIARWVAPRKWTCVAIDGDRVAAGDAAGDLALWALHDDGPA